MTRKTTNRIGDPGIVDPADIVKMGAVSGLIVPELQIQPNGIDLSVQKIWEIPGWLEIDFTNEQRRVPDGKIVFDSGDKVDIQKDPATGKWSFAEDKAIILASDGTIENLEKGAEEKGITPLMKAMGLQRPNLSSHSYGDKSPVSFYKVQYHEHVTVPPDMMAQVFHRSTLMRGGGFVLSSVWDSGYEGCGIGLLMVHRNTIIHKFARIGQIVFHRASTTRKYEGKWNKEGIVTK